MRFPYPIVCWTVALLAVGLAAAGSMAGATAPLPAAVSPGHLDRVADVPTACPTFLWGTTPGAEAHELLVYALPAGELAGAPSPGEPVLGVRLPGSVHGWTPSLEECLDRDISYAWLVGVRLGDGATVWSEPRLFRVAPALSRREFEAALAIVRDYLAQQEATAPEHAAAEAGGLGASATSGSGAAETTGSSAPAASGPGAAAPPAAPDGLALTPPDTTALRAEDTAVGGVAFGLLGISGSTTDGSAGAVGQSTATSGDTIGVGGEVASAAGTAGVFDNTAGGDVLRGFSGGVEVFDVDGAGDLTATGAVTAAGFTGDGSGLTGVIAESAASADDLDCVDCVSEPELDFDPATQTELDGHTHPGEDIVSGTVAEPRIAAALARDGEVFGLVTGSDGSGSGLDADLLDGIDSAGFLPAGTDLWVDETGDRMTGTLTLDPGTGFAFEANADVNLFGNILRSGTLFLHETLNLGVGLGSHTLAYDTGFANTAVGQGALRFSSTGSNNTAVGFEALLNSQDGDANSAFGFWALQSNTSGSRNTAVGYQSMMQSQVGGLNTASGFRALYGNSFGNENNASGAYSLYNSSGSYNTAVGARSLHNNSAGDRNIAIGHRAGYGVNDGDDNILVGNEGTLNDSATIRIGAQGTQNTTYIAGISGTPLGSVGEETPEGTLEVVVVNGTGQLGTASGAIGDADTLDGLDSGQFLRSDQTDSFTSGTLSTAGGTNFDVDGTLDAGGASSVSLPSAAASISGAGSGSGLDSDLLDGLDSSDFLPTGTDLWVDEGGDMMTGTLTLTPGAGNSLEANADINLAAGNLLKGGTLFLHDNGTGNTGLGAYALASNTTGYGNTAGGSGALGANTTGYKNTASGHRALGSNTYGYENSALGYLALYSNTDGYKNTASGETALYSNTDGSNNTASGAAAMRYNTSGSGNTAGGFAALRANTTGSDNTATGAAALLYSTGSRNTALGSGAGLNATTGDDNIFIANVGAAGDSGKILIGTQGTQTATYVAGISGTPLGPIGGEAPDGPAVDVVVVNAVGQLGTATGSIGDADTLDTLDSTQFLRSDTSDSFSAGTLTADGGTTLDVDGALDAGGATSLTLPGANIGGAGSGSGLDADLLDGLDSTAFLPTGTDLWVDESGDTMTGTLDMGGNPIFSLGDLHLENASALRKGGQLFIWEDIALDSVSLGRGALEATTSGSSNTAVGNSALVANTIGFNNTAVGAQAGASNTEGSNNTALGAFAFQANSTGSGNTAVGQHALNANSTGGGNTAVGVSALLYSTTGYRNTAVGSNAMRDNTMGSLNAAFGDYALVSNTEGNGNTSVGFQSMTSNTTGSRNTALGVYALVSNTTGSYNTALGQLALGYRTSGTRNVGIGYRAGINATAGDDSVFILNEGAAGDSAKIRIGTQGTQTATYLAGVSGTPLGAVGEQTPLGTLEVVVVNGAGQLGTASGPIGDADTLDGLDSSDFATGAELAAHVGDTGNPHAVTLDQVTPTAAKGDLLVETGAGMTALAVGGDGQMLYADSSAPAGVGWRPLQQCPPGEVVSGFDADGIICAPSPPSPELLAAVCEHYALTGDTPPAGLCEKTVFVTSSSSDGDLGGLAGADATCQALADAALLSGTFKAWLSDSFDSPSTRFTRSSVPYKLVDGTTIATDWNDLTNGGILAPINKDETGAPFVDLDIAWTTTLPDGTRDGAAGTCGDWTSSTAPSGGGIGQLTQVDADWTDFTQAACLVLSHLYCFQQ